MEFEEMKIIKKKLLLALVVFLSLAVMPSLAQAGTITANATETNINSTVLLTGTGFSPSTAYYLIPQLENKSSWWDGFNENWFFSTEKSNTTINITTDPSGNFTYNLYIPNDWRVSGGKVSFKVGESVASSLLWSTQGTNWLATQPTKNGVTGDSNSDGFIYTASTSAAANQGGIEKFYKSNGTLACRYNWTAAVTAYDITNNGSIAYVVTSATTNNLQRINMAGCTLNGQQTTAGAASYSVNVAPDNSYIIITYAASTDPRKYMINVNPPVENTTFNPTAVASIGYDSCISPDGSIVYIGYANGNVTALNANSGALIWNSDPEETELGNAGYAFPVYGLSCDNDRVYVARGSVAYPTGITNQGFVEALYTTNGSRAWVNSKTDTIYDGMDVSNIRCDSSYCYAVKLITPAPYAGVVGSAIVQINKTDGNVTWQNWRSWLPTTYNGAYGSGGVHSSAQTLWVDTDTNGYLYPVYTNGWVQQIAKNDVNTQTIETNLWIRGLTNFWNYVADVPKNIWLSNETPYYNFRHWNQQGMSLNTNATNLLGTFFRYSMLNTFNSFTAYEYTVSNVLGNSIFIDPVMQVAATQRNEIQYFNGAYHTSCPNTRYSPGLFGWHYQDRACHYEEIPATLAGYNIGTTINGTFITGVVYSLIKTKFWDDYPITKYYGNDKWAWASWYNQTNNQQLGFTTKFGSDQEDVYSDIYGRAVLFTNYGTTYYYRPQFRADLNIKTDTYIFFKPQGGTFNGTNYLWGNVDQETQKVASPVNITLSTDEVGTFSISGNDYGNRINFTAQEPNLFNRDNEPAEIIFNATGGIRSDCQDVIITDETDTPISLWQVDNFTSCSQNSNVSVWMMMNWTQNETKNLRLYYNSPSATPSPAGTTDLTVTTASGSCGANNHEVNINSTNWYYWQRPAAATVANEITKFNFNNTANLWVSSTHYQVAQCYKNSNTTITGAGVATDTCGTAAAVVSRCLQAGGTGKIFAKLNATVAVGAVTNRPSAANTLNVEYYFFANTGRVRIRTQLNSPREIMNTTVSKNWPPYYYFSINSFIPPSGTNSWLYYSGLYEQMKKPVAAFNADQTEANLSSSPLPLLFTIKYGGFENFTQANGSIYRPATVDGSNNFWDKGCTAHKEWQYYAYSGGASYGTSTAPAYTSEFISCDKSLESQLPKLGEPGYVNVIPEMAWDGTTVNRWYDPSLIGKFYMQPNTYRPYNRENRYLAPYAVTNPYTTARISSYIIPVCPEKEYGYKGYDDFLTDLPNLIANTSLHIRENTENIPCAAQVITRTDARGSDGTQLIFARNLSVIVGETIGAGATYPFNTFASGTYAYQTDGNLDLTFAQKSSTTAGYYGKYYFTYTPNNYVIDAFATSGNPQFMTAPGAASSYNIRYSFAPESFYNKNVWDETALWDKTSQNFSYYRNPCWLGRYNNIYGSTEKGHSFLTTNSTPGWQNPLFGAGYQCAHSTYNMETQDVFRPGWSSIYPTAAGAAAWNELIVDGRMNLAGTGNPTEAGADTYYVARHASLFDYKHNDDFNSVYENIDDLNQNEKHPNKQPWYCQISRHTNRSFCVMTNSMSSLIYNYNPGGGLTTSQPWSPYWSSVQELSTFRNYFVPRYFDTSAWLFPYDNSLDVNIYPTLGRSEVLTANLLYTSANADDYETFFRNQFPTASYSQKQTQFLLKDWKNAAFMYFDQDTRQYASGQLMNVTGVFVMNGNTINNQMFNLQIFKNDGTYITTYQTSTNSSGNFNWLYTLPSTLTSGLYYVYLNYNNSQFTDSATFTVTTYRVVTETDKSSYSQGETASITHTITDYISGTATDPTTIQEEVIDSSGTTIKCSRYPSTTVSCTNLLTKSGTGIYSSTVILDQSLPSGDATIKITTTDANSVSANYYSGFGIGKSAGTITISLNNSIVGTTFTSNVSTTNTGYEQASKSVEVTAPTSCGYITSLKNSTNGDVTYYTQDLSSACKVYWTVTLAAKNSTFFVLSATLQSSGEAYPGIELDAPDVVNTNTSFGIVAFVRNTNGLLTNCDTNALLKLKDSITGSILLNGVVMNNSGTGQYNYTTTVSTNSTFLAEINCSVGSTTYVSNPKVISSQNIPISGGTYPTIELSASTPIATSTSANIGALIKSSTGILTNCDGNLAVTIRNLADGTTTSGTMVNFGTGTYNYSWTTAATAGVLYVNASCSISSTTYTGFTVLSTQTIGTNTLDYNEIAAFVWNYTLRNLTYYNQSVAENLQSCLRDSQCSNWWINTTLIQINTTVNQINSTVNQIKTNTETLSNYFDCSSSNEICTRLQNILNNATDIQTRVYSLNTTQIPNLNASVTNVYADTQYIRTNMVTASGLSDVNDSIWWLRNNIVTQAMFESNMTEVKNSLNEINTTTQEIKITVDCSDPANSVLCTYLNDINNTANSVYLGMATYSQVQNVQDNATWIINNVATQEAMNSNFTDIKNKLTNMNTTLVNVHDDLVNDNQSLSQQVKNVQDNVTWIINNVATSQEIQNNFTETFSRLSNINNSVLEVKNYLYGTITTNLAELNTTTQNTYSYLLGNVSTQVSMTEILSKIDSLQDNVTYVKNNMFYQGNATGSFLVDYLSTVFVEPNNRAELWIVTRDLLGNQKTVSTASCDIRQRGLFVADATTSISSGGVYSYWNVSNQPTGEYYWNCTLTGSTLNLQVPFFVSGTGQQINQTLNQNFNVRMSDFGTIAAGEQYLARTYVTDYLGNPLNASSLPRITLYDPLRNIIVDNVSMQFSETGIYAYNFTTASSQTAGQWEAVAKVAAYEVTQTLNDFWELASSPAQVKINSISDNTIPTISADVTITNEGNTDQEYQYEYCVVSNQTNQCGGGDDVDYASGAKLIKAGQNWNTQFSLDKVNETGDYWFKIVVYFGTQRSGASRSFTAIETPVTPTQTTTTAPSGGGFISSSTTTPIQSVTESEPFSISANATIIVDVPKSDDLSIQQIEIKFKNDVVNAEIAVKESKLPTGASSVIATDKGAVYKYLEIEESNITDSDIDEVKMNFKVSKSWVGENNINATTVGLFKYEGEGWTKLPTVFIKSDSKYYYFVAQSMSLSTYAIAGQKIESEKPLFDVTVEVPAKYKTVNPGEELVMQITLFNVRHVGLVDVNVTYGIKDHDGNVFSVRYDSLAVEAQISVVRSVTIPPLSKTGDYVAFAEVKSNGDRASGTDSFFIVPKPEDQIETTIFLSQIIIISLLVTLVVITLYILMKKRRISFHILDGIKRKISEVDIFRKMKSIGSFKCPKCHRKMVEMYKGNVLIGHRCPKCGRTEYVTYKGG